MTGIPLSADTAILATLVGYLVLLVAIGVWASRRTHDAADFFLGGRRLGAWIAALSASASSSSAWTLLGVSGAAYVWGLPALWLFPATLSGFAINWFWVAPRLQRMSRANGSLTLTEFLASPDGRSPDERDDDRMRVAIVWLASGAIIIAFVFYVAAQFQAAGHAFAASFGWPANASIAVGAAIVVFYTLLGGFWAVSMTDMVQGLLMVAAAVVLPSAALVAVGGPAGLAEGLHASSGAHGASLTGEYSGLPGIAFVLGTLGIGLGYPGQPHVVNRFMALHGAESLSRGRAVALAWAVLVYAGMLLLGLCARVLFASVPDGEQVLFHAAKELLPPALAGLMVAAVLSAIMSTADSQLLVVSSSVSWDLRLAGAAGVQAHGLAGTRAVVVAVSLLAMMLAMAAPATIFARVLFAWHALGSAFGPLLVLRLAGRRVAEGARLASIALGFGLTVVFFWMPDTPGDWVERLVPPGVALAVAWSRSRPMRMRQQ